MGICSVTQGAQLSAQLSDTQGGMVGWELGRAQAWGDICIHKADLLCYTAETTQHCRGYIPVINFFFLKKHIVIKESVY